MNIKNIITAAVLVGSSSAALAQPAFHVSGGVRFTGAVAIRDHRTPRPVAPPMYQTQTREWSRVHRASYDLTPAPAYDSSCEDEDVAPMGWFNVQGRPAYQRGTIVFDVNTWLGSIRFDSARGDNGAFDADIVYADGRVVNLSGMRASYQNNLAPGVVTRIIVRDTTPGSFPRLIASASNH